MYASLFCNSIKKKKLQNNRQYQIEDIVIEVKAVPSSWINSFKIIIKQ